MNDHAAGTKVMAWVRITRLQFFPMTCISYTMGALAQSVIFHRFEVPNFAVGYLVIFLIEWCTILVNEYQDYQTDRLNQNYSIYTGGSRVLVEGKLSFREVRSAIVLALILIVAASALLLRLVGAASHASAIIIVIGLCLGLGYTLPPARFSYRGVGEIVVGATHSIYVILCGFVFQGGSWDELLPWLLGLPLFFAVLAANILAGIPDRQADEAVKKRSVAVMFGSRSAIILAILFVSSALLSGLLLEYYGVTRFPLFWFLLVTPHAFFLVFLLFRLMRSGFYDRRINGVMGLSLGYIIWFGILPLFSLVQEYVR
jgi:1,4-dihydroxy-2-naphthoate polyprenyltransferase